MATSDVELIAAAVEDYLVAHPDGADSADGIAGWWLPAKGVVATIEAAESALDLLVQRGLVRRQHSADGRVLYSRRLRPPDPRDRVEGG